VTGASTWPGTRTRRTGSGRSARVVAALVVVLATQLALPAASPALTTFDPTLGELPEGIAIDHQGTTYVTLSPRGEIRRIARDGTQSTLAQLSTAGVGFGPLGLAFDRSGGLFAAVATFDPASSGVYRVRDDGTSTRLAGSAAIALPNALAFDHAGTMFVSDSVGGAVYEIARGEPARLWIADPRLTGDGSFGFGVPLGANGIAYRDGSIYVAVTERGRIVRIPIRRDGTAGSLQVVAESPLLVGADGIAFDVHGALYVLANAQNTLVRLAPGGALRTIAAAADGLDFPAGIAFGRGPLDHRSAFVVNFAIGPPGGFGPAVVDVDVGVPGQPLP
jgi:sugar lactone lactonase YvrE